MNRLARFAEASAVLLALLALYVVAALWVRRKPKSRNRRPTRADLP